MDSSKNPHKNGNIFENYTFYLLQDDNTHITYHILYIYSLVIYLHVVAYMDHAPLTNWDAHHGVSDYFKATSRRDFATYVSCEWIGKSSQYGRTFLVLDLS